jgi:hypothetical protein
MFHQSHRARSVALEPSQWNAQFQPTVKTQ